MWGQVLPCRQELIPLCLSFSTCKVDPADVPPSPTTISCLSPWLSPSLSPGYLVVPAGGGGTFLGGFFVNKLRLRGSAVIKFCLFCTVVSLLGILVFSLHCPGVPMAGVTASYSRR